VLLLPCETEFSDSAFPLPLTTNPGVAIEEGMMPTRVGHDGFQFLLQLVLSPPLGMNCETKSVARRVASHNGTPQRIKSLVFISPKRCIAGNARSVHSRGCSERVRQNAYTCIESRWISAQRAFRL
jgi:hypothetical protein